MLAALILICWMALTLAIFHAHSRRRAARRARAAAAPARAREPHECGSQGGICCGLHAVCEKGLPKAPAEDLYFNDEELDALSGRDPRTFTAAEREMLLHVRDTLLPAEEQLWRRCLGRRGIHLPPDF